MEKVEITSINPTGAGAVLNAVANALRREQELSMEQRNVLAGVLTVAMANPDIDFMQAAEALDILDDAGIEATSVVFDNLIKAVLANTV